MLELHTQSQPVCRGIAVPPTQTHKKFRFLVRGSTNIGGRNSRSPSSSTERVFSQSVGRLVGPSGLGGGVASVRICSTAALSRSVEYRLGCSPEPQTTVWLSCCLFLYTIYQLPLATCSDLSAHTTAWARVQTDLASTSRRARAGRRARRSFIFYNVFVFVVGLKE
jgi:hypothetical protein